MLIALAVLLFAGHIHADQPSQPAISAAEVTIPQAPYAQVILDFDVPAAEPVSPLFTQWRYMGGMRDGRMRMDQGLGLREPGGYLAITDGVLKGTFEHMRRSSRNDARLATITIDARVNGNQIEGTAQIGEHHGKVTGQIMPDAALTRSNALPHDKGWPSFLGPVNTGVAAQSTGVKLTETPSAARLIWKTEETDIGHGIGAISRFMHTWPHASTTRTSTGSSSPILAEGKVFFSYYVPSAARENPARLAEFAEASGLAVADLPDYAKEKIDLAADDIVLAVDAATGKTLWKAVMKGRGINHQHHKEGPFNMTPAYHDGRVFAIGMSGALYAFAAKDGTPLWETQLGSGRAMWSASVVALPGVVVAPSGGVWCGFDPDTGNELWKSSIRFVNAAVAVWQHQGKHYIISGSGGNLIWDGTAEHIVCLDAITGAEVWRGDIPDHPAAIYSAGRGSGPGGITIHGDHLIAYTLHVSADAASRTDRRNSAKQGVSAWKLSLHGIEKLWDIRGENLSNGEHLPVVLRDRFVVIGDLRVIDLATGQVISQGSGVKPGNGGYLQAMEDMLFARRDGTHGSIETGIYKVDENGQIRDLLDGAAWRPSFGGATTSYHHPIMYPMLDGRVFLRQSDGIYCWDFRAESRQ